MEFWVLSDMEYFFHFFLYFFVSFESKCSIFTLKTLESNLKLLICFDEKKRWQIFISFIYKWPKSSNRPQVSIISKESVHCPKLPLKDETDPRLSLSCQYFFASKRFYLVLNVKLDVFRWFGAVILSLSIFVLFATIYKFLLLCYF